MNQKGVVPIFALPILIFVVITLILTGILFTYFPSLAIAAGLGVTGAFFLYTSISKLDQKAYQGVFVVGVLMLIGTLLVGIMQPFDILGNGVVSEVVVPTAKEIVVVSVAILFMAITFTNSKGKKKK